MKNFAKGGTYKRLDTGSLNILTLTDKRKHGKRRRLLAPWFTDKGLKEFEPRYLRRINKFCSFVYPDQAQNSSPEGWGPEIDLTHTFSYLVSDTLSDFVFGVDGKMLEMHDNRPIVNDVEKLLSRSAVLLYFPFLFIGRMDKVFFPQANKASRNISSYMRGIMKEHSSRARKVESQNNVFSYLQNTKDPQTGELLSRAESKAEAVVLTMAGKSNSSGFWASNSC